MQLEADLHVHTVASGHGYSTVKEIIDAAAEKGLKMLAITDHGLKMPGAPHLYHFTNMVSMPKMVKGIEILAGVEANIIDVSGNIDVPEQIASSYLDIVLAGFHDDTGYQGNSVEENTRAIIGAIKNPQVHAIVHPGNPEYPVDIEKVVLAAKKYNKAIELNNHSFVARPDSFSRCRLFAKLAKKHKVTVVINSDAHVCYNVGECQNALKLALDAGIDESLILNTSAEKVKTFLAHHKTNLRATAGSKA